MVFQHDRNDVTHNRHLKRSPNKKTVKKKGILHMIPTSRLHLKNISKNNLAHYSLKNNSMISTVVGYWLACIPINMAHNWNMGLSENRVYIPNYSHLIGIMISKTIGFRGTNHFQTHPYETL